ncbi:diguanylate cyclase domain-containing protein [Deinococcus apachensis]|uniref:diguanylate cyclase domain-containing protein n=1 Tax=Deinococcus apachensis TaxID=309886 RepID=UPI00036070E8|nr:diguanylate cyclase [Deinococcus apachensis]
MTLTGPDPGLPPPADRLSGALIAALDHAADPALLLERGPPVAGTAEGGPAWRAVFVNRAFARLVGGDPAALLHATFDELIARVRGNLVGADAARFVQRQESFRVDLQVRAGGARWMDVQATPLHLGPGAEPTNWWVVLRDVTAERQALALATGQARALHLAVRGAPLTAILRALIATLDERLPGSAASASLLDGDHLHFLGSPRLAPGATDLRVPLTAGQAFPCARAMRRGQAVLTRFPAGFPAPLRGELARAGYARAYSVPVREAGGPALAALTLYGRRPAAPHPAEVELLGQFADLMALLVARDQGLRRLEHLAFRDPLTTLANRARFMAALEEACLALASSGGASFAVGLLDLDDFKRVNDAHGHLAGDHLLVTLAGRIARTLPPRALAARMGGDEFALLVPNATGERVQAAAHAVRTALEVPVPLGGASLQVGGSLGWALAPHDDDTPDGLLRHADAAMYTAKRGPS